MPENAGFDAIATQKVTKRPAMKGNSTPPAGEQQPENVTVPEAQTQVLAVPQSPRPATPAEQMSTQVLAVPKSPRPAAVAASVATKTLPKQEGASAQMLLEQCRQLGLSIFLQENSAVRSLGFTSAIGGEGKSFLSLLMARVLANDSINPVTLLECNWEHPTLHKYYGLPALPGLAELLRGECSEANIRHRVGPNLSIIPAGNGRQDAVRLLQQVRRRDFSHVLAPSNELLIVDLPAIVTTAYGQFAASLVETLILVIHTGATPAALVEEASARLDGMQVHGVILNQLNSRIPPWIRQIM